MTEVQTEQTMTPEEQERAASAEAVNSVKVELADLCAKGTSNYAHKNYNEAADYFARASELQAEINGEMEPQNAELLFLYGRSLFKVGQGKSDVLGGRAAGERRKSNASEKPKKKESVAGANDGRLESITEEGVALIAEEKDGGAAEQGEGGPKKPLFQFTGDENFEDSDEEEGGNGEEDDEEEDDLAAAFEVLDLARVLFTRRLEQGDDDGEEKGKIVGDSPFTEHIKERLADTHDLLAEISLENERFPNAVSDFRASLAYKQELYPKESEIIAEAHFKLSLALEFASITTTKEDGEEEEEKKETHVDEAMREEAAKELEAAISSTKMKLHFKEAELAESSGVDDNDVAVSQIAEVKEIVADMEQRLLDLRAPPIDVNAALNGPASVADGITPIGGILGATLGESPAEAEARIEEAKRNATDLTGLIRRKKAPKTEEVAESGTNGKATNGKRKAEDLEETVETSKKARVEDADED